jgi:hypothetical protein
MRDDSFCEGRVLLHIFDKDEERVRRVELGYDSELRAPRGHNICLNKLKCECDGLIAFSCRCAYKNNTNTDYHQLRLSQKKSRLKTRTTNLYYVLVLQTGDLSRSVVHREAARAVRGALLQAKEFASLGIRSPVVRKGVLVGADRLWCMCISASEPFWDKDRMGRSHTW